ncbi:THO complex subunit 2 isoform X2 [Contarinia nasturtii]|uniref:THO complex subunit 2 isoform X2 n=1 Tax=Contarinia nasturtii TaxID=265458 RepID=UPI0012D3FEFD|nr:THO complex subunit 2 isoform X2 [Contarinia nasturtii]
MASSSKSDALKSWEKSGKSEITKYLKSLAKSNENPFFLGNDGKNPIFRYIYDLLHDGIRGVTKKDVVSTILADIAEMHTDMPSVILDIIAIFDAETSNGLGDNSTQEERIVFCEIVKKVEEFLSDKLLKERLDIDTLQEAGIIKTQNNVNNFYQRFIKVKTKLYYKQRRFNLFREESEGYAKLIAELNHETIEHTSVNKILEIIKSLIGCFNLDPNRVLDITLESFETRPEQHRLFIELLRSYMPNANVICEILGYKYRYFHDTETPRSLYIITALLLQCGLIRLDDIYVWLSPTDRSLQTEWEQEIDDAKEYVRKLNVISTNKDKEIEIDDEKDDFEDNYEFNQKWNLCEALLTVGDWKTAQTLIDKLPEQSVIVKEPVAKALACLIHHVIDPVYMKMKNRQPRAPIPYQNVLSVPKATSILELRENAFAMATKLGPALHHDPILLYKLIRIMNAILTDMKVDANTGPKTESDHLLYFDCITLIDASVLPALSYMDCNCCIAEEIWSIIKIFPYHHRYSLYARWKNDTYLIHPKLIRRRGLAQKQIKALMKRVSKENVKPVGRSIGKLSHCSPGFLFDYILKQIQIYDNLIGPVVDSLKYLTSLSYDVLGYCLIEALALADRNRFKLDGTSLSMWLQGSANFCGSIYKKYNIELSGLLQYVANQLKAHKSLDLLILKEVCQKMTGVDASEEMTTEQLEAMAGGELLRNEAGYFGQVRNTKKSSQRLKDALASNDLAVTLCLLMAQQKHCVVYRETADNHLKLVGKLYDQCQDTLVQFGTFLGSSYSVDEYMERFPSIHDMLQVYHIHTEVAFFLARPIFAHQISQKYDQLRKADTSVKKLSTAQKQEKYLEATSAIIQPIVESVRLIHPMKVWEDISPQFLVTFWSLAMYDLEVPNKSYEREIQKLKKQSLSVELGSSKSRKEQERYVALMEKLQDERKKQQEHVDKIKHRLNFEKDQWFLSRSAKSAKNETITQFLQLCLFPRCTFTAPDAMYCAKFVHLIHTLKTPNFSTLLCYDRIFCEIAYSVTSCTENEATRYGRFLCAMLETVMRWHSSQATFEKECASYPGFVTKFRISNQCSADDHVGYENFRHVCHKWHYKITRSTVELLQSKDYMQIRNALIILMRILPNFPVLSKLSQILEKYVNKVIEEEKNQRQDLFVLATSYIGQLKNKAVDMMKEADFHQVSDKPVKNAQETTKVVNGNGTATSGKHESNHVTRTETKEVSERTEKRSTATTTSSSSSTSTNSVSIKQTNSSSSNNSEKEVRKENKEREEREPRGRERERERDSTEKVIMIKEKNSSKDSKRDKDDGEIRKRDRAEKRDRSDRDRDRKYYSPVSPAYHPNDRSNADGAASPEYTTASPMYVSQNELNRFHPDTYDERERDRDLSSISNSSKGSNNRRSQDSPDEREGAKRRRVESLKKNNDDVIINVDESSKRERSNKSERSKEKREKSTYDEIEMRKEPSKRSSRKRNL